MRAVTRLRAEKRLDMNNAFAIVYAKQGDPQLRELVELRSVAALPFAGRYRMIDVILSNLTNSGVRSVGLITQRNYKSLIDHIGSGKEWNLSKKVGGLMILPPYDLAVGNDLYQGLPDALFSKRDYIEHQRWRYCLLIATDKVYRQDFNAMMDKHIESGADITVLYSRKESLKHDDTGSTYYFQMDGDEVVGMSANGEGPGDVVANLGASIMDKELLMRLVEDTCADGLYNFDMDLLARNIGKYKVVGIEHEGYVGPISSVKTYFDLNTDMLNPDIRNELFDPEFPIYTKTHDSPPSLFESGCDADNSLFGNGCTVKGKVSNSIVFRGVQIDEDADIDNCIIMQNSHIGAGAKLRNMIIDKDAVIEPGARCMSVPYNPAIVRKGAVVEGTR